MSFHSFFLISTKISHPSINWTNQSFVRICGGQGWIPRIFQGSQYSVDIRPPDTRTGSFWFRVQSIDGMNVRTAPSSRARPIKSTTDDSCFRFECGEYLRASEIVTIHGHTDIMDYGSSHNNMNGEMNSNPSESFAKLYRHKQQDDDCNNSRHQNFNVQINHQNNNKFAPLSFYTSCGEWVHVHFNGNIYLEECTNPPSIKRDRNGWEYEVIHKSGIPIYKGPSFASDCHTVSKLHFGAIVLVNEQVTPTTSKTAKMSSSGIENDDDNNLEFESISWFRLKDGRGFISSNDSNGVVNIIEKKNSRKNSVCGEGVVARKDASSYKLIARLFQSDLSSSTM